MTATNTSSTPAEETAASCTPLPWYGGFMQRHWPDLSVRLEGRHEQFIAEAWESGHALGDSIEARTRFVNLCCALGPHFVRKPENEWALAVLSDARLGPWVRSHQLMRRAHQELRKRDGSEPALARADEALIELLQANQLRLNADAGKLPTSACDVEAVEIRLISAASQGEYRLEDGRWLSQPVQPLMQPVRIGRDYAAPSRLTVLSRAEADGSPARLQVRLAAHGGCAGETHPAVCWLDGVGLHAHTGPAAGSSSWPVPVHAAPSTQGLMELAAEHLPQVDRLEIHTCGLRDEGVPLGAQSIPVWVYPATQWLLALQRDGVTSGQWPQSSSGPQQTSAKTASQFKLERNGRAVPAACWLQGFEQGLTDASTEGFGKLFSAWQSTLQNASMQMQAAWLKGRQAITWGWRSGPGGLTDDAVMRVVGLLDLNCSLDLSLTGEIQLGHARSIMRLHLGGQARAEHAVSRETNAMPLLEALGKATLSFCFPFTLELDPIATPEGVVCHEAAPCTGAIAGEAGLRPRLSGGSGWEWFVRVRCEPVMASLAVQDPVLGTSRRNLLLLPGMALFDWSLG